MSETVGKVNRQNNILTLIDYHTSTCPPCKMLSPIIEQVANEYKETTQDVLVLKVNLDEFPESAKEKNITSVPTLILYYGEKELSRKVGFMPKNKIIEWIEKYRKELEEENV